MKCRLIRPEMWANTMCPLDSSTRNMALGRHSCTFPSTSILSFFAIPTIQTTVSISALPLVTAMVCSKCAERLPSDVTTVH
jgi:hypothetical protein